MNTIRPWGQFEWFLDRITVRPWRLISCLSAEERCLAGMQIVASKLADVEYSICRVLDEEGPLSAPSNSLLHDRYNQMCTIIGQEIEFEDISLMESVSEIHDYMNEIVESSTSQSYILDVSCFPKRIFFSMLKALIRDARVQDLVCVYTRPHSYVDTEPMAQNFSPFSPLSGFSGLARPGSREGPKTLLIGIGHHDFGMASHLSATGAQGVDVQALFPFPPGPPSYEHNWRFLFDFTHASGCVLKKVIRVSAVDVSEAYDQILKTTDMGAREFILAPYGPKPVSVAMCLAAIYLDIPVYYTQPKQYSEYYSIGISRLETGRVASFSYFLKRGGEEVYLPGGSDRIS